MEPDKFNLVHKDDSVVQVIECQCFITCHHINLKNGKVANIPLKKGTTLLIDAQYTVY
jgi:hypothetical protein